MRGRFDLDLSYRVEGPAFARFLKAIYRGDHTALRVFADWLLDQGDPRGEEVSRLAMNPDPDGAAFRRLFGLRPEHAAYLRAFNETRRVRREAERRRPSARP